MRKPSIAIIFLLFVLQTAVAGVKPGGAPAPATVTFPYLQDVSDILTVRSLIAAHYPNYVFVFDTSAADKKSGTLSLVQGSDQKLDSLIDLMLKTPPAMVPAKTDSLAKGTGSHPGGNQQTFHGPYVSYRWLAFPDAAPTQSALKSELLEVLFITDYGFRNRAYFSHLSPFSKTFSDLPTIIEELKAIPVADRQHLLVANPGAPIQTQSTLPTDLVSGNYSTVVNDIIYGIVDWAISAAKQQLLEVALGDWYKKLTADPVASKLLSNTLSTINAFQQSGTLNLAKYGDLFKAAFQKDLENLPVSLQSETLIKQILTKFHADSAFQFQVAPFIAGGMTFVYGIHQKKHPVVVLDDLATQYESSASASATSDSFAVMKKVVILTDVLANIFGVLQGNVYTPVSIAALKALDAQSWQVLLRLAYMRNNTELGYALGPNAPDILTELNTGTGTKLLGLLSSLVTTYSAYQTIVSGTANSNTNTAAPKKTLTAEEIGNAIDLSLSLIKNTATYLLDKNATTDNCTSRLFNNYGDSLVSALSQIGTGLSTQQYGQVLNGSLQLLQEINGIVKLDPNIKHVDSTLSKTLQDLAVFGSFMTNVLSAKSPQDIQNSLSELIPQDQYKLKNQKGLSVSVSAYPGIIVGRERIKKYGIANGVPNLDSSYHSTRTSLSPYLPIGIDVTYGLGNSCFGIFVQLVDLGAVLNYRLNNSDTAVQSNPNISWQQLLSPGAMVFWQIKKTPIVIGFNFNYTPGLRKVEQSGVAYQANACRLGLSATIDVTALHIRLTKDKTH